MTTRVFLPDTNAFSRDLRGRNRTLSARMEKEIGLLRLSAIVWYELSYGAEKRLDVPALFKRLEMLRRALPDVEPFDDDAAWHAARVRSYLETVKPNAQPIGPCDVLIAGHALSLGATLVTANVDEFSRVPGLVVENWEVD